MEAYKCVYVGVLIAEREGILEKYEEDNASLSWQTPNGLE